MKINDTIEFYLRRKTSFEINKTIEKLSCKECGSKEKLEIHHATEMFSEMVEKAFEISEIKYRQLYRDYSEKEKEMLVLLVLGIHYQISDYKILCQKCHDNIHSSNHKKIKETHGLSEKIRLTKFKNRYYWQISYCLENFNNGAIDFVKENFNKLYLEKILKENEGKTLDVVSMKILLDEFFSKFIRNGGRKGSDGIRTLRKFIEQNNIQYYIKPKTISRNNKRVRCSIFIKK